MILLRPYILLLLAMAPVIQGCQTRAIPCVLPQDNAHLYLANLERQKDDIIYEIQLRQNELDQMTESAKGAVGVTNQWLERKSQLTEQIIVLRVKAHDLDLQIVAAK